MTKTVYFSKNVSKFLRNHTISLPKRQSCSHSRSGSHNKFLTVKNSNFSERRIFKLRACILGHRVALETDGSVYRTWNLKMKATISTKHNFSCLRLHNWDVTTVERCSVSAVYGRQVKGQAGRRRLDRHVVPKRRWLPVTSQKCEHLVFSKAEAWNHSRPHDCQY